MRLRKLNILRKYCTPSKIWKSSESRYRILYGLAESLNNVKDENSLPDQERRKFRAWQAANNAIEDKHIQVISPNDLAMIIYEIEFRFVTAKYYTCMKVCGKDDLLKTLNKHWKILRTVELKSLTLGNQELDQLETYVELLWAGLIVDNTNSSVEKCQQLIIQCRVCISDLGLGFYL